MKKMFLGSLALIVLAATLQSAAQKDDEVMTKENGVYVVNTTTLGKDVQGYAGTTPVKVYIKKNKVEKVEKEMFTLQVLLAKFQTLLKQES